jgi:putative tryptophan/tyrosine transport system substrate-binding protein
MLADPAVAQDQRSPAKKIGILLSGTAEGLAPYMAALVEGLRELGWVEGTTAHFIMRYDNDDKKQLPKLAAELVALRVDVLAAASVVTPAARSATTTIPIVTMDAYDPIAEGLTSNLGEPRGNVTGVSAQSGETAGKRVELARDLVPRLQRIALLSDPGDSGAVIDARGVRTAVERLGLELRTFEVRRSGDFPAAFAAIKRYKAGALIVTTSTLTMDNMDQTARFISRTHLPAFSEYSSFAEAGFLLTYGVGYVHLFKLVASQINKILTGAKPANLPWEQPTQFELTVNLKTAKALGLTVPGSIMAGATKTIR